MTSTEDRTTIVDGGAWTVDHGDHTHYYAAEPRVVGTVDGGGPVEVHSSETMTTITWPERGEGVVLDRAALGQGDVEETTRVDSTVLLSFGEQLVAGTTGGVRVLDADGQPTGAEAACAAPAGGIVTRAGAVVGCEDGAVVVGEDGEAAAVALPDGAERPTAFSARAGRPTVAGLAGDRGVWLLDTRERAWTLLPTPEPVVQATAVDDKDENVLALTADGRVLVVDGVTGAVRAASTPLVGASLAAGQPVSLIADQQRAYLNGPTEGRMWEIDFVDDARVAREFTPESTPLFFAETGR